MDNRVVMDRLERTSRISTLLMALGAVLVLGALWLSYGQLRTLQTEVRSLESEAAQLRAQNSELSQRAEAMRNEITGLREALTASRSATVATPKRSIGSIVFWLAGGIAVLAYAAMLLVRWLAKDSRLERQSSVEANLREARV